jgi:hypothetical protein
MKVKKIGRLKEGQELLGRFSGAAVIILTNIKFNPEIETTILTLPIIIGEGLAAREVNLEIAVASQALIAQQVGPTSLVPGELFTLHDGEYVSVLLFQDQIFTATADFLEATSEEEAILLVKRQVLSDDSRLKRLRHEVQTLERVMNASGIKRIVIPEDVKLLVFSRDEGACVRCGKREKLHFDHVIPVAKGGGNSEDNIQILCEYCNLQKSDKIAF